MCGPPPCIPSELIIVAIRVELVCACPDLLGLRALVLGQFRLLAGEGLALVGADTPLGGFLAQLLCLLAALDETTLTGCAESHEARHDDHDRDCDDDPYECGHGKETREATPRLRRRRSDENARAFLHGHRDSLWRGGFGLVTMVVRADVAELVDAHGSGPCGGNPVEVQVLSSA